MMPVSDNPPLPLHSAELGGIDALMRRLCEESTNRELGRLAWEHIGSGGKRLRARLAVQAVVAQGAPAAHGVAWGAACELLHNASLIHDDIEDGDRFRRGRPALWARHGVAQAINAGDLCIALSYAAIAEVPVPDAVRWGLTATMTRAARHIAEGQAAELSLLSSGLPSWSRYAACVEGKTSALFALPAEGAALIAGRSMQDAQGLADACRKLGVLFQVQDDILDLLGDNGRDQPGSDLSQCGKVTALVVEHLRLHPGDAAWLLPVLLSPRADTSPVQVAQIIDRFVAGGALSAVWQRIDDIVRELAESPVIRSQPALAALVQDFVTAALRPVMHTRPAAEHSMLRPAG